MDSNNLPTAQDAWFVMTSAVPRVAMKNIYRASLVAVAQAVSEVSYPSAASAAPPWGGLGVTTRKLQECHVLFLRLSSPPITYLLLEPTSEQNKQASDLP